MLFSVYYSDQYESHDPVKWCIIMAPSLCSCQTDSFDSKVVGSARKFQFCYHLLTHIVQNLYDFISSLENTRRFLAECSHCFFPSWPGGQVLKWTISTRKPNKNTVKVVQTTDLFWRNNTKFKLSFMQNPPLLPISQISFTHAHMGYLCVEMYCAKHQRCQILKHGLEK